MKTSDFYFDLPKELIAQTPPDLRGNSRLMVLHRTTGEIEHRQFSDIVEYLRPNDVLVVNDSRVIPARLYGANATSGSPVELLLVERIDTHTWLAMVHPGKKCRPGATLTFGNGRLTAEVLPSTHDYYRTVRFTFSGTWETMLAELGTMPVPPYIHRDRSDTELLNLDKTRYQTVYAREEGSIAAPTAGLHFTEELLQSIESKGIPVLRVTLHVGTGTFLPVKTESIEDHPMHEERYLLSPETVNRIHQAKRDGGRVIAVGTTTTRVLESVADDKGNLTPGPGATRIFIYPGYRFKCVDDLITNFHLPESTLVMLVSALVDREKVLHAYHEAVAHQYRFYSYGDAMFITQ